MSEHYKLNRDQPTLDFVDVDVLNDVKLFVDPRALRLLPSVWGHECVALVQGFFSAVLNAIRSGDDRRAQYLLAQLKEPNETHLGLSRGRSQGRALGDQSAIDVWDALKGSVAVKSGLLRDLEDTILLVDGVGDDIVSDMTTDIIRAPLIQYTQEMCSYYGIPTAPQVASGALWDPATKRWFTKYVELPVVRDRRLLLVPKVIVRRSMDYDADEYYSDYILEHLREIELSAGTELVHLLKNGTPRVTKKDLEAKYGRGKFVNLKETVKNPELLDAYRKGKEEVRAPLSHDDLAESEGGPPPNWDLLLSEVEAVPVGREASALFEDAIEKLLSALLYPSLANPRREHQIHEGRKRIDVTYTNLAKDGFFSWLAKHYPASHVFVECKNYGKELGNPELDQLTGRFSPSRGTFGMLVCRSLADRELFVRRCIDTAKDSRGFVVVVDDGDLAALVEAQKQQGSDGVSSLLKAKFDRLIM